MLLNHLINLPHDANRLVESDDDAVIVFDILR